MIPQLLIGVGAVALTFEIVSGAAAAGAGYGLGRKYGRKLCDGLDKIESSVADSVRKFRQ
tara:strand:- start:245 stop:424 length:180 start_codon:yes stop_codon:yes gene_type:complete